MADEVTPFRNDEAAADALINSGYMANLLGEEPEQKATAPAPKTAPAATAATEAAPAETTEAPAENIDPDVAAVEKYRLTVKNDLGNDEEIEMTIDELKSSVMMEKDYRRKTSELSKQRETFEQSARQAVEQERNRFLTQAQSVQRAMVAGISAEFPGVDITNQMAVQAHLSRLAKEDPAEAVRASNRLNELFTAVNVVTKQMETERARANQAKAQSFSKAARDAWETLGNDIKGWNDETYNRLLKTGMEYGFKPQEIANPIGPDGAIPEGYIPATDPRFIKLLHDADQYRQLQRAKPVVDKRVAEAPKVLKPGSKAKAENQDRQKEAMGRLRKSGKVDDAAAAIFERLG